MRPALRESAINFIRCRTTLRIFGLLAGYAIYKLYRYSETRRQETEYRKRIEENVLAARKERKESIDRARFIANEVELEERKRIGSMTFLQLRDALQSEEISCETVIRVYFGLALKAHEKTNCITYFITDALVTAVEMDRKYKGYDKPPLFGIPISIKDAIDVADERSTAGLYIFAHNIARKDAQTVKRLKRAGMIPFCKTNVPPYCMTYMTSNALFGTTTHPLDPTRTSGGSSGGEGALIAAGGSLIGLGGDIGGSIRVPAAYSGCCGFKPTSARFTSMDFSEPAPMRPFCMAADGPLASHPVAIVHLMRVMWDNLSVHKRDPLTVPVLFREDLFSSTKRLRIGFYTSDGYVEPLHGIKRAIQFAIDLLKDRGHEIVPFSPGSIPTEMAEGFQAGIMADGGAATAEILKDEELCELTLAMRQFGEMSTWRKRLYGLICKLRGDTVIAKFFTNMPTTAMDMQRALDTVYKCRRDMIRRMREEKIDLLLCPATLSPALPHDLPNKLGFTSILPTMLWNAMDFPAGVVPVKTWSEKDEEDLESYKEKGMVERGIKNGSRGSQGLPIGVQLVALPYRDEIVLRAMVDLFDSRKSLPEIFH